MSPELPLDVFLPMNINMASSPPPTLRSPTTMTMMDVLDMLKIPRLEDRRPLTWGTAPHALAYMAPLVYMAYLARRPDTYMLRLMTLPVMLFLAVQGPASYMLMEPSHSVYNWFFGACFFP